MNTNSEVVKCSDVIILAIKPYVVSTVLKEICGLVEQRHLIVSIAAGIKIKTIENVSMFKVFLCVGGHIHVLVLCKHAF